MIQDIFPNRLDNQYVECSPQDNDVVFFFEGSSLLAKYIKEDTLTYPLYKQFIQGIKTGISKDSVDNYSFTYLLSVDMLVKWQIPKCIMSIHQWWKDFHLSG